MSRALEIGWYGKLPSAGDFVSRRMPRTLLGILDEWLRHGLIEMREVMPDEWREVFASAPAWNCAIPACVSGGSTLIGLLAPSHDQVGREFPLCAGVALPPDADSAPLLADAHGWMWTLGKVVTDARERRLPLDVFDAAVQAIPLPQPVSDAATIGGEGDIFSVLGPGPADVPTIPMPLAQAVPWPGLPALFDPQTPTSFWWTNPGAGGPLRGFSTDGPLAPSLLVTLMRPPAPPKGSPLFS